MHVVECAVTTEGNRLAIEVVVLVNVGTAILFIELVRVVGGAAIACLLDGQRESFGRAS